jgi:hypothetical protein
MSRGRKALQASVGASRIRLLTPKTNALTGVRPGTVGEHGEREADAERR